MMAASARVAVVIGPGAVGDPCGHGLGQLLLIPACRWTRAGRRPCRPIGCAAGAFRSGCRALLTRSEVAQDGPDTSLGDGLFIGHDPSRALRRVVELHFQDHRRSLGLIHLIQAGGYLDAPVFARRQGGHLFHQPLCKLFGLAAFGADPTFGPAAAPCVAVQGKVQVGLFGVGIGHHLLQSHARPVPVQCEAPLQVGFDPIHDLVHPLLFGAIAACAHVVFLGAGAQIDAAHGLSLRLISSSLVSGWGTAALCQALARLGFCPSSILCSPSPLCHRPVLPHFERPGQSRLAASRAAHYNKKEG